MFLSYLGERRDQNYRWMCALLQDLCVCVGVFFLSVWSIKSLKKGSQTQLMQLFIPLLPDLTYEVTCLKRRLSESDGEADTKVKELDRQLKAMTQDKENVGRVGGCL